MASRLKFSSSFASFVLCVAAAHASAAIDISKVSDPAAPSFRGAANTTWFGWTPGSFDGTPDNGLLDNPAITVGTTTAGVGLAQNTAAAIVSGSNNIYSPFNNLDLTITAPTNGTAGTGFTTIIVQGRSIVGPFGSDFAFAPVGGATPSLVVGNNSAGNGQFFAKYEVPGNAASYNLVLTGGTSISIASLQVDTLWSSSSFAADLAVTPEPASIAALAGVGAVALRRRRSN